MWKPDHKETNWQINRTQRKEKELEQEAHRGDRGGDFVKYQPMQQKDSQAKL